MSEIGTALNRQTVRLTKIKLTLLKFFMNLLLIIFSLSCVYPIIWIFISSFKTAKDFNLHPVSLPTIWETKNYIHVLTETMMPRYILNSTRVTVISVFLIILIAFITGYFLARFQTRFSKGMYAYYMVGLLIPIHALLVPLYIITKRLDLVDTPWALVLPYVAFGLPVAIFLVESYIHALPREMEEAASIDGSSFTRTLFTIILPMSTPILVTASIIQFFNCWNEFMFALILLSEQANFTVPLGLTFFKGPYSTNYPMIMTATIVSIAPVLLLYMMFSGKIINGIVAGAIKG